MRRKYLSVLAGFVALFLPCLCYPTTLIFDAAGNIVGNVAGTWGGAATTTQSVSKVGAAIGQGITQTLAGRGFSPSDPRVISTVKSVSSRVATSVATAGAGTSWLGLLSRINTIAVAGVLVYQGVNWYFDSKTGQVTTVAPGTTNPLPIFSNGVQNGQMAWTTGTAWFGSPEEAFSYGVEIPVFTNFPTAVFSEVIVTKNGASAVVNYKLKATPTGTATSYSKNISGQIWTYATSCSPGYGVLNNTCVSAGLDKSHWANAPIQTYTPQQAYDNLSQAAKDAQITKELITELSNRLWKDAASQPDYQGVPWSAQSPVTPDSFAPYATQNPEAWPSTKQIADPVSTVTPPVAQPFPDSSTISNPTSTTTTKVDLGPDPGTPPPTLEDPPTDLFKPIKDVMEPWLSWQVPNHSTVCPTWHASPSIAGHVFDLDLSYHCTFIEQYRDAIATAAIVGWVVIAVFIVLSA